MRYQPKAAKVWVWIQRRSHRTTMNATMAETAVPRATMVQLVGSGPGWRISLEIS